MDYRNEIYSVKYHSQGTDALFATPHHDESVEIIQIWSDGGYFIVGNHILPIKTGSIIFVDAMETHYSNPENPDTYNRSKIIVSKNFFRVICDACDIDFDSSESFLRDGVAFYNYSSSDNAFMTIDHLYKIAAESFQDKNAPFSQANIVSALTSILTLILPRFQETEAPQPTHTIGLLANYINSCRNNWQDISMKKICNNLHISPSRVSHLFKDLTGKSLTQYITLLRMAEAKRLLLSSKLKVKDISIILKFDDPTTFCRYFKKYVGCTPKEYRDSNGISISQPNSQYND